MLNHLRECHSPEAAAQAEKVFEKHIRSRTTESPRLAGNATEFAAMDFEGVASAVRDVAAIAAFGVSPVLHNAVAPPPARTGPPAWLTPCL